MPRKLFWQIFPTFVVLSLAVIIILSSLVLFQFKTLHLSLVKKDLKDTTNIIAKLLLKSLENNSSQTFCKTLSSKTQIRITLIDEHGNVLADSEQDPIKMNNHSDREEVIEAILDKVGVSIRYSNTLKQNMMYVALPFKVKNKKIIIRTSLPLTIIEETQKKFYKKTLLLSLIILLLSIILTVYLSRKISIPLEQLRSSVELFSNGQFSSLPGVIAGGSQEINSLARTLSKMAKDLNSNFNTILSQQKELETILDNMSEGVIAVDKKNNILTINKKALSIFEIDIAVTKGDSLINVIRNNYFSELISQTLMEKKPASKYFMTGINNEKYVQASSSVFRKIDGNILGVVVVVNDVSKIKKLENIRRDFIANVSHELKTPVTSIKGYIETILEGAIDDKQNALNFLKIISSQTSRLNNIIDDLLMLARIEEEEKYEDLNLESLQIIDVLESAKALCLVKAKNKNISIQLKCNPDLIIKGSKTLMEQAVVNLLDNAIKYSSSKTTIFIGAESDHNELIIQVIDQGIGIKQEYLPRLFERFYRVDKARSRKIGGTGLGLAIVKHIALIHNGSVAVSSVSGQGSKFSIIIPS